MSTKKTLENETENNTNLNDYEKISSCKIFQLKTILEHLRDSLGIHYSLEEVNQPKKYYVAIFNELIQTSENRELIMQVIFSS